MDEPAIPDHDAAAFMHEPAIPDHDAAAYMHEPAISHHDAGMTMLPLLHACVRTWLSTCDRHHVACFS